MKNGEGSLSENLQTPCLKAFQKVNSSDAISLANEARRNCSHLIKDETKVFDLLNNKLKLSFAIQIEEARKKLLQWIENLSQECDSENPTAQEICKVCKYVCGKNNFDYFLKDQQIVDSSKIYPEELPIRMGILGLNENFEKPKKPPKKNRRKKPKTKINNFWRLLKGWREF